MDHRSSITEGCKVENQEINSSRIAEVNRAEETRKDYEVGERVEEIENHGRWAEDQVNAQEYL